MLEAALTDSWMEFKQAQLYAWRYVGKPDLRTVPRMTASSTMLVEKPCNPRTMTQARQTTAWAEFWIHVSKGIKFPAQSSEASKLRCCAARLRASSAC